MAFICTRNHNKECDACGYCEDDTHPVCPICGKEADTFAVDKDGDIIGCDKCVRMKDAYEEAHHEGLRHAV